jgi:UDP-3-O-[3-hydroxymyristoyl] glucosamine N-acyltransferase
MKLSLNQIADLISGQAHGELQKQVQGIAPFETASADEITFADSAKYYKNLNTTGAGTVIVPRGVKGGDKNVIQVDNPKVAFAKLMHIYYPPEAFESGIHPTAVVGSDFGYGQEVSIGPMVVVGNNVSLGDRVRLDPGVVLGNNVTVGSDVRIYPNVSILKGCRVGSQVIIHAGSVIGSDGYGFAPDGQRYHKIPQVGIVQIDDDVEIGAGNTIDRATFGKTWIQRGVKTDNMVHIAHNVTVGEDTVIVAQTAIAGSTTIGRHVAIAGQVAISGHIRIGDNVSIGGQSGVPKSVPDGEIVSGTPAMPHRLWLRVVGIIPRLPELKNKLASIEKRLNQMEGKQN